MKKFFVIAVCLFVSVVLFVSFDGKKREIIQNSVSEPIECVPYYEYDPNVRAFVTSQTVAPIVRKNVNSNGFSLSNWKMLSQAYGVMKGLNNSLNDQPTSWDFQAKIHGGNPSDNPIFHTCQHGNCFFLAWHRMYLYFFERIFRHKLISAGVSLTRIPALPYWNSINVTNAASPILNNDVMPSKFRQKRIYPPVGNGWVKNFLYEQDASIIGDSTKPRGYKINKNSLNPLLLTHLDRSSNGVGVIENRYNYAISFTNFHKFQNAIEKPHNDIHLRIGGMYMPSQNNAAYDPIFYSHHANIDRLWQNWLKLGKGRCNPTEEDDSKWANTVFKFYDEKGSEVSLRVNDILKIAPQLNYVYDDYTKEEDYLRKEECDKSYKNCESFPYPENSPNIIKIILPKYYITEKISNKNEVLGKVLGNESIFKNGIINITNNQNSDIVFLEFDKIDILQKPQASIEIYINPKDANELFPNSPSFAGTLNLFSTGQSKFKHHDNLKDVIIINDVIKNLNLTVNELKKARLCFVVRGNIVDGKEVATLANVVINEAAIVVYKRS